MEFIFIITIKFYKYTLNLILFILRIKSNTFIKIDIEKIFLKVWTFNQSNEN
jgi:hypothetical protein